MRALLLTAVAALLLALALLLLPGTREQGIAPTAWELTGLLGGGRDTAYARVTGPRPFTFPEDHGPHPAYRHEWWYLTGHLDDAQGRRYGFQVTFFRFGLGTPPRDQGASAWRAGELYMAHFAVTDAAGQRFIARERFARAALGLAGASAAPFRVWLGAWELAGGGDGFLPLRLAVDDDEAALQLDLSGTRAPVPQGDDGFSRKGAGAGEASHYYSLTRMDARGTLRVGRSTRSVRGSAWLDREWGSAALPGDVAGWDWFALQLDDGRDLMLYLLRRQDGTPSPFSAGGLVAADGRRRRLARDDFAVEVLRRWSAADGTAYPSRWRITVPSEGLALELEPLLDDQELRLSVRYWEGAVSVGGSVGGRGYVELTGYATPSR